MTPRRKEIKEQVHTLEVERLLKGKFGRSITASRTTGVELVITVKPEKILDLMTYLRGEKKCAFDYMMALTAVDYPEVIVVTYLLYSMTYGTRLTVKAPLKKDKASVDSITPVWPAADWPEREAAEMFGVEFVGHPDPRKILLPDDFAGYPLRKDFENSDNGW